MKKCLICDSYIEPFISFGKMPIANNFVSAEQFGDEYFFNLQVGFCEKCKMVQLTELVDRERMFHDHYAFYSSTSTRMALHFKKFADTVCQNYLKGADPFIVEIGSNDGIMLKHFARKGIRHIGIEPSSNVAQVAMDQGMNVATEFFDADLAKKIVSEYGQADTILGANVMCHIPYLHSVVKGIEMLLKPGGVLIFEDPYLGDIIQKTSYDQIYDEHAFYFSLASISYLCELYGLEIIDVERQDVHGGSMRYVISHKETKQVASSVTMHLEKEKIMGIYQPDAYEKLGNRIEWSKRELVNLLKDIKKQDKRVVGYAATSKSTTVLNYCSISSKLIEFISDTTPIKQGKFSPGVHIPIHAHQEFEKDYPDYALLFAWNHSKEIMEKEKRFRSLGGKWIVYVPKVKVL
ncbi:MAG: class I SAM-dependent methyltransferase [Deltaproteobacteria bacterium]|nr:class I SAM-dependent methyltransferase [Deltaproteobacteria bacterium]